MIAKCLVLIFALFVAGSVAAPCLGLPGFLPGCLPAAVPGCLGAFPGACLSAALPGLPLTVPACLPPPPLPLPVPACLPASYPIPACVASGVLPIC